MRFSEPRTSTLSRSARARRTHADLIAAAARAGKAILCEKPVSLDLEEVDRALAAVAAAGVPFQIGFNRRFDPSHAAVRDAVADGAIGEPHLARISSRDPAPPPLEYSRVSGGLFLDMTMHDFDMARYVTGSEVIEVYARGAVRDHPARRLRRRRHRRRHAHARERLPDGDRQQPPGRLRLRPARRGVRLGGHGRLREPARAHCGGPRRGRHAPRGDAVLLPRPLPPHLHPPVGGVRRRGPRGARRRWAPRTHARRS